MHIEDVAEGSSVVSGTAAGGVTQSMPDIGHQDMDTAADADATISDDTITIVENLENS